MKRIIVIKKTGRLANQLWPAASVYAFCLEKKYACKLYFFFQYQHLFGIVSGNGFIDRVIARLPRKFASTVYRMFSCILFFVHRRSVVSDKKQSFSFSPSPSENEYVSKQLKRIEESSKQNWYLWGWAFRNSVGLQKYKKEIKKKFKPIPRYQRIVDAHIAEAHVHAAHVVGIHVRHGDYKTWNGGKYFYSFSEVRKIIDDFLKYCKNPDTIHFIICSDGHVPPEVFSGIDWSTGPGSAITDLYTLAACDMIIGSASTYGGWASYYGDISMVRFSHKKIDWSTQNLPHGL